MAGVGVAAEAGRNFLSFPGSEAIPSQSLEKEGDREKKKKRYRLKGNLERTKASLIIHSLSTTLIFPCAGIYPYAGLILVVIFMFAYFFCFFSLNIILEHFPMLLHHFHVYICSFIQSYVLHEMTFKNIWI